MAISINPTRDLCFAIDTLEYPEYAEWVVGGLLYQAILREHVMGSLFRLAFRQLRPLQPMTGRDYCRSLSARKPEHDRAPIRSHVRHKLQGLTDTYRYDWWETPLSPH